MSKGFWLCLGWWPVNKIQLFGETLSPSTLTWFCSYFHNRKEQVIVKVVQIWCSSRWGHWSPAYSRGHWSPAHSIFVNDLVKTTETDFKLFCLLMTLQLSVNLQTLMTQKSSEEIKGKFNNFSWKSKIGSSVGESFEIKLLLWGLEQKNDHKFEICWKCHNWASTMMSIFAAIQSSRQTQNLLGCSIIRQSIDENHSLLDTTCFFGFTKWDCFNQKIRSTVLSVCLPNQSTAIFLQNQMFANNPKKFDWIHDGISSLFFRFQANFQDPNCLDFALQSDNTKYLPKQSALFHFVQ